MQDRWDSIENYTLHYQDVDNIPNILFSMYHMLLSCKSTHIDNFQQACPSYHKRYRMNPSAGKYYSERL